MSRPGRERRGDRQDGYSIVELVVVLALAALILLLPALQGLRKATLSSRAASQVASDFRVARMRAISRQQPTQVRVQPPGTYVIEPDDRPRALPAGATIRPLPGAP